MRLAFLSIGRHIHTERWIRWFAENGHDCHLLTVQPGSVEGVTVHDIATRWGPKPWRYLVSLAKVKRILAKLKPDLLNTHFLTGYGYWGHFSGFHPNVLTVWGDDVYVTPRETPLKRWLARRALGSCECVTGDSTDILAACVELGARAEACYRVLWGVDFERFRPGTAESWRIAHGFEADHVVFFSPRSYTQPYYNIDTVIRAAAEVMKREPRARFLFSGYEGDPGPFRQKASAAGILPVTRMVGRLPHQEFATALQASDVFISVPSVDATAVSLLEAMACGRAIIVSNLKSSVEWIREGHSGLVVPPRQAAELSAAMLRLAADSSLRRTLGEAALVTARKVAGFETNMTYVDGIFRHLVQGRDSLPVEVSLPVLRAAHG